MSTDELRQELESFYEEARLRWDDGVNCPSYKACEASCRLESRRLTAPTGAYVGDAYSDTRILFVGINTNRGSSNSMEFYSCYNWVSSADTAHSPYIDWVMHRVTGKMLGTLIADPSESKRHFAFTNVVKCSVASKGGRPTKTMGDNCSVRHGYLYREIEILSPRIVVAVGEPPYSAIVSHYVDTATSTGGDVPYEWAVDLLIGGNPVVLVRLANPVQGYQSLRRVWNRLRDSALLEKGREWMLPLGVYDAEGVAKYLDNTYSGSECVDRPNPFYELLVDKLVSVARARRSHECPC